MPGGGACREGEPDEEEGVKECSLLRMFRLKNVVEGLQKGCGRAAEGGGM
jgi:hypothetical protein